MPHFRLPILRRTHHAGFTLVELVIVMAITSLLATIAFIGQRQLRDREVFDDAVNKVVQEFAYAKNFSSSNVNYQGAGNDPSWVVAGAAIEFDNGHPPGKLVEVEGHYCQPGPLSNACSSSLSAVPGSIAKCGPGRNVAENECLEEDYSDPKLSLSGMSKLKIFYLNESGKLHVCQPQINDVPSEATICSANLTAPLTFTLVDGNGRSADIRVDPSGDAVRLN